MSRRVVAALLWFYTGWTAATFGAWLFGISEFVGPIVGGVLAALVVGDPFKRIWWGAPGPRMASRSE